MSQMRAVLLDVLVALIILIAGGAVFARIAGVEEGEAAPTWVSIAPLVLAMLYLGWRTLRRGDNDARPRPKWATLPRNATATATMTAGATPTASKTRPWTTTSGARDSSPRSETSAATPSNSSRSASSSLRHRRRQGRPHRLRRRRRVHRRPR